MSSDAPTGLSVTGLTSFGEDSCGHVYATAFAGPVYRLDGDAFRPCPAPRPPTYELPPDRRAPRLALGAKRVQRVLRQRGVRISLRCDEMCGATSRATMRIGRSHRRLKLRTAIRQLAAGKRTAAKLRMSKRQRRLAARGLRRHRRVRFSVRVVARDAAGNASRSSRSVRARR